MIRTTEELLEKIGDERTWRRKELTVLRALVQDDKGGLYSRVLIRGAIALLYAHWEGFVKITSAYYLEYVASQRLTYGTLSSNFVGLALRAKFAELHACEKIAGGTALCEFFRSSQAQRAKVPYKNVVDTQGNLSSTVLRDFISALGLDESQFSTRLNYIDTKLVNPRNHVAHGEDFAVSVAEYLVLHDDVVALIDTYQNEVENACVQMKFKHVKKTAPEPGASA